METLKSIGFLLLVIISISIIGSLLLDILSFLIRNIYILILAIGAAIFLYKISRN